MRIIPEWNLNYSWKLRGLSLHSHKQLIWLGIFISLFSGKHEKGKKAHLITVG